jgi:hypothetical protein
MADVHGVNFGGFTLLLVLTADGALEARLG